MHGVHSGMVINKTEEKTREGSWWMKLKTWSILGSCKGSSNFTWSTFETSEVRFSIKSDSQIVAYYWPTKSKRCQIWIQKCARFPKIGYTLATLRKIILSAWSTHSLVLHSSIAKTRSRVIGREGYGGHLLYIN